MWIRVEEFVDDTKVEPRVFRSHIKSHENFCLTQTHLLSLKLKLIQNCFYDLIWFDLIWFDFDVEKLQLFYFCIIVVFWMLRRMELFVIFQRSIWVLHIVQEIHSHLKYFMNIFSKLEFGISSHLFMFPKCLVEVKSNFISMGNMSMDILYLILKLLW